MSPVSVVQWSTAKTSTVEPYLVAISFGKIGIIKFRCRGRFFKQNITNGTFPLAEIKTIIDPIVVPFNFLNLHVFHLAKLIV
jgi:hypothetical protein